MYRYLRLPKNLQWLASKMTRRKISRRSFGRGHVRHQRIAELDGGDTEHQSSRVCYGCPWKVKPRDKRLKRRKKSLAWVKKLYWASICLFGKFIWSHKKVVATQTFFSFTPKIGDMIQFDLRIFFSNGLVQPPTRKVCLIWTLEFIEVYAYVVSKRFETQKSNPVEMETIIICARVC